MRDITASMAQWLQTCCARNQYAARFCLQTTIWRRQWIWCCNVSMKQVLLCTACKHHLCCSLYDVSPHASHVRAIQPKAWSCVSYTACRSVEACRTNRELCMFICPDQQGVYHFVTLTGSMLAAVGTLAANRPCRERLQQLAEGAATTEIVSCIDD